MPREFILANFDKKNLPGLRNELQRLWNAIEKIQSIEPTGQVSQVPTQDRAFTVQLSGSANQAESQIEDEIKDDFIKYFLLMGA